MGTSLLASLIILSCQNNNNIYKVQNYSTDCHQYLINCTFNKDNDIHIKSKETIQSVINKCLK